MASNQNQPATKSDGEMRAVAGYILHPNAKQRTWKLLASLHERRTIPELCVPHGQRPPIEKASEL